MDPRWDKRIILSYQHCQTTCFCEEDIHHVAVLQKHLVVGHLGYFQGEHWSFDRLLLAMRKHPKAIFLPLVYGIAHTDVQVAF